MNTHISYSYWTARRGPAWLVYLILGLGIWLNGVNAQATTRIVPPNPTGGRQAKATTTIDINGFFGDRPLESVFVTDQGAGYSTNPAPVIFLTSTSGSGAQLYPLISTDGKILFLSFVNITNSGSGYSDDLTIVIMPPHTNDFQVALNDASCDTIVLQSGLYYQNAVIDRDLTIRGNGIGKTIVSGGLLNSVFKINPGHTVHLQNMTIIDGLEENGGGIYNDRSTVFVEQCEIKNCRAYGVAGEGGGIYNRGSAHLTVTGSNLHDNAASRNGGGISNSGLNTSLLPAVAGGAQTAASVLQQTLINFTQFRPPADGADTSAAYDDALTQIDTIMSGVIDVFTNVPALFKSVTTDPFDPNGGWSGMGSPTAIVTNSVLTHNQTGTGVANTPTSLTICLTPDPNSCVTTSPKDIRFSGFGGGIHNDLGLLIVANSTLTGNSVDTDLASFGGGISSFVGVVSVTNTKLNGNEVDATTVLCSGGALYSFASLVEVSDSDMNNNTVKAGLFISSGGAVKSTAVSFMDLTRCRIQNNISGGGGGVANDYLAILNLADSSVISNSVSGIVGAFGGGVRNENGGNALITGCTLSGNSAKGLAKGGGLYNQCEALVKTVGPISVPLIAVSTATLRNCTISGNTVNGKGLGGIPLQALGAGLYNASFNKGIANLLVTSSTICSNSATDGIIHEGGGLYNSPLSTTKLKLTNNVPGLSTIEVANDLLAGNTPNDIFSIPVALVVSLGYNLDSDGSGALWAAPSELALSAAARFRTASNAHLAPLANNGGRTFTHDLLPGSAALDLGSPDGALDTNLAPLADQRGVIRSQGGRRDIGAVESIAPEAFSDTYSTLEDQLLRVPASAGLLANDLGDVLSIQSASPASHGTVTVFTDGSFTYLSATNYNGPDSFAYVPVDVYGRTGAVVAVTIHVNPRLDLLSIQPTPNKLATNPATSVQLTFDEPVSPGDAVSNLLMAGSMSGGISFQATSNGNVITLTPNRPFQPGETVTLTPMAGLHSSAGSQFWPPIDRQFTLGAASGEGLFAAGPSFNVTPPNTNTWYIAYNKLIWVDLNGDGKLDIVSAAMGNSVWINHGNGVFVPTGQSLACPPSLGNLSVAGASLAVADLNGDGYPDVFVVSGDPDSLNSVWFNYGDGTFYRSSQQFSLGTYTTPIGVHNITASDVALGDLNGDGFPDVFITSPSTLVGSRVWLNDGQGNFTSTGQKIDQLIPARAVRLADLNGDGFLDAFVISLGFDQNTSLPNPEHVWINDGTGFFTSNGQNLGHMAAGSVVLGDVNGDGFIDAVVGAEEGAGGSGHQVWLNNGAGQFTQGQTLGGGYASTIAMGDLNADGAPDLVIGNDYAQTELWLNDGHGNFTQSGEYLGTSASAVSIGDADGDGDLDVLVTGPDNRVWLNARRVTAGTPPSFTVAENGSLTYAAPQSLLQTASSPSGIPVQVVTTTVVAHRGNLGALWIQYGFDITTTYEDGEYVYRQTVPIFALHGHLDLHADGTFTYSPNTNYFGPDSFTYTVTDGLTVSLPVTVNINVTEISLPPVANNDWYLFLPYRLSPPGYYLDAGATNGVLANDTDPNGLAISPLLVTQPQHGSLSFNTDGSFHYSADNTYSTLDQFTYVLTNSIGLTSGLATVTLGYYTPIARDDFYALTPGKPLTVDSVHGVLANDTDPNLASGQFVSMFANVRSNPQHGTLSFSYNGSFTYTPTNGYTGADSFTYAAGDYLVSSYPARVKLGNTAPVAVDDPNYVSYNGATIVASAAQGVLANDYDSDQDPGLTATLVAGPAHGTLSLSSDGSFTYQPTSGYAGLDTFTYQVSDGFTNSNIATATINDVKVLQVVALSPPRNGSQVASNADIQVTFNVPLVGSTLTNRLKVYGSFTGGRKFTTSANGAVATIHLNSPLLPGEQATVVVQTGIQGTGFYQLRQPTVWQFTAAVPRGGGALFTRTPVGTNTINNSKNVYLADLNGDGYPDAFVVNDLAAPTVLINQHNRTFSEHTELLGMFYSYSALTPGIVADFNNDGYPDVVVGGWGTNQFGIYPSWRVGFNDGTGHFPTNFDLPLGNSGDIPTFFMAGDFDGDGNIDIFGADDQNAWIWRNDGRGNFTFDDSSVVAINGFAVEGAAGDVNNDGYLDAYLVGFNGDRLLINDGTGHFTLSTQPLNTDYAASVFLADLNGDGQLDVLLNMQTFGNGPTAWFNDGTGHFRKRTQQLSAAATRGIAFGDLNADGSVDFWQARNTQIAVWANNGSGFFTALGPLWTSAASQNAAMADLDGDGDMDLFVVNDSSSVAGGNEVWFNQSPPRAHDDFYAANGASPVTIAASAGVLANDVVGDGGPMTALLVTSPAHGAITLNSDGSFTYTPGSGFSGSDVFTYQAHDSITNSAPARVKIGNSAPLTGNPGPYIVVNDTPFNASASVGLLAGTSDAEKDSLSAILASPPSHGTIVLSANGAFTYMANPGYLGLDSFTYHVSDGFTVSTNASVTLDVRSSLSVLKMTPAPSAVSAKLDAGVVIQFNHPLDPASVTSHFIVSGKQSGTRSGTNTVSGDTLTFLPTLAFLPGEEISVIMEQGLHGTSGEWLPSPLEYSFVAEALLGDGIFTDSGQRLGGLADNAFGVAIGDLNGDGFPDLFIVNGSSFTGGVIPGGRVWLNDGTGNFTDSGQVLGTQSMNSVVLGDVDNNGSLDAVTIEFSLPVLWLNDGTGHFTQSPQSIGTNTTSQVALVDVNGDGNLDLIELVGTGIHVFLNDGAGHFTESLASVQNLSYANQSFVKMVVADVDGDGDFDIVLQDFFTSKGSRILLNDGRGNIQDSGQSLSGGNAALAIGDLNGDGFPDLFMPQANGSYVWFNNGAGVYTNSGKTFGNYYVTDVKLADVNGDGKLDAVVIQRNNSGSILTNLSTIYLNDGQGNFTDSLQSFGNFGINTNGSAFFPNALAVGDLNGDGALDILLAGGLQRSSQIWLNHASLPSPRGIVNLTINDTATAQPFANVELRTPANSNVALTLTLDNTAKGTFTPASLAASGFSGPIGATYSLASTTPAAAQAALSQLVFAPVPNRVAVGASETTTMTLVETVSGSSRTNNGTTVTAISINDTPLAKDDTGAGFTTTESAAFTTGNVLANDQDPDPGDTLTITSVITTGTIGQVINLGDGTFRYDPNGQFYALPAGATATDTFVYTIQDPHGASASALVSITIQGQNQPPVAVNDAVTVVENSGTNVITAQVLQNDTDPDTGDKAGLFVSAIDSTGTIGNVQLLAGNVLAYKPDGAFANLPPGGIAQDSFGYTVSDGHGGSSSGRVSVTISGRNDPPVAGTVVLSANEHDGPATITSALLAAASDPDPGETATLRLISVDAATARGQVTWFNGVATYSPNGQFSSLAQGEVAVDTFGYTIQDVHGTIGRGVVHVTINGQNDPPVAVPDYPVVPVSTNFTDLTAQLLSNDTDPDNGETASLTVSAISATGIAGSITFSNGIVRYQPPNLPLALNETATDAFQYTVKDIHGATSSAVATVYIVGVNSPPVISNSPPLLLECATPAGTSASVTNYVSDTDGNALEVIWNINGAAVLTNSLPAAASPNSNAVALTYTWPLGTNILVSSVSDGIASPVYATNTVTVVDTTPPVLTLLGANPFHVECHGTFVDPGATASDACAGDLTSAIQVNGQVDPTTQGTYTITYTVSDPSGHSVTNTRTVIVSDTLPPVITLKGPNPMTNECHLPFFDPGATATDACSGDLTSHIKVSGKVDSSTPGLYRLVYVVSDNSGNTATNTRTVYVADRLAPLLIMIGNNPTYVECHTAFKDLGALAYDLCAGDLTSRILAHSTVDANTPGRYSVVYSVSDSSSNIATATRTVIVVDTKPPTLTLKGANPLTVECHTAFVDPGATAIDVCAGDLSKAISVRGTVDTNDPGHYTLTYTVTDPSGNTASKTRTVIVTDTTPPVIGTLTTTPSSLTPADHRLVLVTVNYSANDLCGAVTSKLTATSSEADKGLGKGDLANDIQVVDAHHVNLRAERFNTSRGRTYTLKVTCTDSAGNSAVKTVTITVP